MSFSTMPASSFSAFSLTTNVTSLRTAAQSYSYWYTFPISTVVGVMV